MKIQEYKGIKSILIGIFFCICFLLPGCKAEEKETVQMQFFYENACASCKEEEKIYEIFNRALTQEEKEQREYELRVNNTIHKSSAELYQQLCQEDGVDSSAHSLPALKVNDQWFWGYDSIEKNIRAAFLGEETEETPSAQESASLETAQGEEEKNSFFTEMSQLSVEDQEPFLLLFSTYSCTDCQQVKEYLEELKGETSFQIREYSIAEGDYIKGAQALFEAYQVPEEKQQVPIVFYGSSYLSGAEEICQNLKGELEAQKASYGELKERIAQAEEGREEVDGRKQTAALFGAGLLAGFNPCSISMLLMVLSILLTVRGSVWKHGLAYLAGKYVTYFLLGLGIYAAASSVDQGFLDQVSRVVNLVVVVLFILAAAFNFIDFWNVRKKEYGKIRMQLPAGLRKLNHRMIKRAMEAPKALLLGIVLGLGIAVSMGEFFCTGQIYMASILYTLKAGTVPLFQAGLWFFTYVTAMCIPSAIFIAMIQKTRNTSRISEFMLNHMEGVKFLNGLLFLVFAVYFLIVG